MTSRPEKRLHPRVSQHLAVRATDGAEVALETLNLSAGGLFCTSPAWVAPMTRLALLLELPALAGQGAGTQVRGEAVVVRTEPPAPSISHTGGYRIARFFSHMEDDHRHLLQSYLKSRTN
jgi:hypothetical protein